MVETYTNVHLLFLDEHNQACDEEKKGREEARKENVLFKPAAQPFNLNDFIVIMTQQITNSFL